MWDVRRTSWPGVAVGVALLVGSCGGTDIENADVATTTAPPATTAVTTTITTSPTSSVAPEAVLSCPETGEELTEVDFAANWEVGTSVELNVRKSQERNGTPGGASDTPATIQVLGHGSDGYLLSWSYGVTLLDADTADLSPQLLDELTELASFTIEYRTDEFGLFESVTNVDELQDQFRRIVQFFEDNIFTGMDPSAAATTRELLAAMSSDEQIGLTLAEDVITYHSAYGYIVEAATPLNLVTELPNILGGDPFPAIQTVELAERSDGCIPVQVSIIPEPVRFREILAEVMAELAIRQGLTVESIESELGDLKVANSILSVWEPQSTWFVDVIASQTFSTASASRIDTTRFTVNP